VTLLLLGFLTRLVLEGDAERVELAVPFRDLERAGDGLGTHGLDEAVGGGSLDQVVAADASVSPPRSLMSMAWGAPMLIAPR
jgi:hypothetical protein